MDVERDGIDVADGEIVAGRIIFGIKVLRDHFGCSLHEALDAYSARYEVLRRDRPADFSTSHEEYWKNFYS
ncbi:hypothetical protein [Streptomyces sp. NPDC093544]|uniref:hypothetical protein n=1 Tax=Streptomyces sp. NPDC093544 TaxID=3155200 RepID=UPI00343475DC